MGRPTFLSPRLSLVRWVPVALAGLWVLGVGILTFGPNQVWVTQGPPISIEAAYHPWSYVLSLFVPSVHLHVPPPGWPPRTDAAWGWLYGSYVAVVSWADWGLVVALVVGLARAEIASVREADAEA